MDELGVTLREPEAGIVPRPVMVMSVAFCVCQVRVVDWPCWITSGAAAKVAVGVAGGGGDGGVTFATFLLHPARMEAIAKRAIDVNKLILILVINSPLYEWLRWLI
jgi:hypothetical protein